MQKAFRRHSDFAGAVVHEASQLGSSHSAAATRNLLFQHQLNVSFQ
jgi:hypothetical protein